MLKAKKSRLFLLFLGSFLFIFYALYLPFPKEKEKISFYSTHTRDDLRLLTLKALKKAKESIHIHTYCLSDPQVLSVLIQKAREGVDVHITYHQKNTPRLETLPHLHLHPTKGRGLMHAKWVVIDHALTFLGTANLTPSSLSMHENLIVGLCDPNLAEALISPEDYQGKIGTQNLTLFLLPNEDGLKYLLATLDEAKERVCVALFTLTHPLLVKKLIELHQRGLSVDVILDHLSAKGASKKALNALLKAGIAARQSQGMQLFHHKWALIDDTTFVIGSANWTQAAFKKNKDFILFISPLNKNQIKKINRSVDIIKNDSTNCN